ncbi:MAG: hypothetical protein ABMA01_22685 [Chthoniobacteraceae bacterium]
MKTVLVGFQCDPALKAESVAAAAPLTVSQYLRSALVEKLQADGSCVSEALAKAPSRLGKGGPKKKKRKTILITNNLEVPMMLNEASADPLAGIDMSRKQVVKYGEQTKPRQTATAPQNRRSATKKTKP